MNREHPPCGTCSRFVPAKTGTGHCEGNDRPANADDHPCPLYLERGSWAARQASSRNETISRVSA